MTLTEIIYRRRVRVLEHAAETGNVSLTCRTFGISRKTFYEWKSGRARRLPEDTMRRIGYVAGIYKALQVLYADPAQADGWVRRPNQQFGGQTPLERMAAGDVTDLAAVRAYVDAARAPWG